MASGTVVFLVLVHVLSVTGEYCLMISEVNADNPKLDTTEFVELYHTSGKSTVLDGYTLVFYNGNGNVAYKVLDLDGHTTDEQGFFLIGSVDVRPWPDINLPPNTVQNGPDAIALYHSDKPLYSDKMNITRAGLVDAIVYTTRRLGDADYLADVLTPGVLAFVEDDLVHEGDESIERCWLSAGTWTFRVAPPSPGQHNQCSAPANIGPHFSELRLGTGQIEGFVELNIPKTGDSLVLVLLDGRSDTISMSTDVTASKNGFNLISSRSSGLKCDMVFPSGDLSVLKPRADSAGAVVLYSGRQTDFLVGSPLSTQQPLDAFVYVGPEGKLSTNLTETLIPGRLAMRLSQSVEEVGVTLSRCGVASWNSDPGIFIEATQTPGEENKCSWPALCPQNVGMLEPSSQPPLPTPWNPFIQQDFVLNEVNADTPGSGEDAEFIEIWHPVGRRISLEGVWLLLFSGHNSKPYREISLTGHFTDSQGYFLVGSDKLSPAPSVKLPPNTIQNGPDAVALYRSTKGPPSLQSAGIPTEGLLDAVVYRQRGSDKEARSLNEALTPGQPILVEDTTVLSGDESLSRCNSLQSLDPGAFVVASPTPMQKNECPQPPTLTPGLTDVVINEVSSTSWSSHSHQQAFVELWGPPLTVLHGLALVLMQDGQSKPIFTLPLTGLTRPDGFYLVGNLTAADQSWPTVDGMTAVPQRGAVTLRTEIPDTRSELLDAVVFSEDQQLLSALVTSTWHHLTPASWKFGWYEKELVSLSRCSCCEVKSPQAWTISTHTPHQANLCPSSAFSSDVHLCLQLPVSMPNCSWWNQANGDQSMGLAKYLEDLGYTGISPLHLRDSNISCTKGWLHIQGSIQALCDKQQEMILMATHNQSTASQACDMHVTDKSVADRSELGWQIGLVVGMLLLLGTAVAVFTYFYKRRHPMDYLTMELNEHADGPGEL